MKIQTVKAATGGYIVNGRLSVPGDPDNRHYQAVQAWIAAGNTPAPADPDPVREPSDLDVRLAALEAKTGVTDADRVAAKTALINKGGR